MELAQLLESRGHEEIAAELYSQAVDQDPAGAEIFFRRDVAHAPDDPSALVNLGNVLARQGQSGEAERLYRRALVEEPDDDITLINLGLLLHREGRLAEAARALTKASALRPHDARVHLMRAEALAAMDGAEAEAEQAYRQALTIEPRLRDALVGLANVLDSAGRMEEAETLYHRALAADPRSWDAHYHYAVLLSDSDRSTEAEREFRQAIALEPRQAAGYIGLARFLARRRRWSEARDAYQTALHYVEDDAETHLELATTFARLDQRDEARAAFARAAELAPENPLVPQRFAEALFSWQAFTEAEERLRASLALRPGALEARLILAALLDATGRSTEATREFGRCLDLAPENAGIRQTIADSLATYPSAERAALLATQTSWTTSAPDDTPEAATPPPTVEARPTREDAARSPSSPESGTERREAGTGLGYPDTGAGQAGEGPAASRRDADRPAYHGAPSGPNKRGSDDLARQTAGVATLIETEAPPVNIATPPAGPGVGDAEVSGRRHGKKAKRRKATAAPKPSNDAAAKRPGLFKRLFGRG
jgi:tetratricopeptide (TPR) repeat protein